MLPDRAPVDQAKKLKPFPYGLPKPDPRNGWYQTNKTNFRHDAWATKAYPSMSQTELRAWIAAGAVPTSEWIGNQALQPGNESTVIGSRFGYWQLGNANLDRWISTDAWHRDERVPKTVPDLMWGEEVRTYFPSPAPLPAPAMDLVANAPHYVPPGEAVGPSSQVPSPGVVEAVQPLNPPPIRGVVEEPVWRPSPVSPYQPGVPLPAPSAEAPGAQEPPIVAPLEPIAPPAFPPIEFIPGSPPKTNPGRGHVRKPPGPGTKEKKGRAMRTLQLIGNVFGAFTEINDIISAAWKAIPAQYRTKVYYKGKQVQPGWDVKWRDVYEHADKMSIDQFVKNLILNNIQDDVIGRLAGGANKFAKHGPLQNFNADGVNRFRGLNEIPSLPG